MPNPKCDFCSTKQGGIFWVYPCSNFTHSFFAGGHLAYFVSKGDWSACDKCHQDMEEGKWDMLALRALESFPDWKYLTPEEALEAVKKIGSLHETFRKHAQGSPYVYT